MFQSLEAGQLEVESKALVEWHVLLDVPVAYLRTAIEAGREGP
jgi:hypothetical protein